jgi:hypothetical protein
LSTSSQSPELSPPREQQLDEITALIGDVKPATDRLLVEIAEQVRDRREHDHSSTADWDWYCLNASGWLGDRMPVVLRRLLDAEARVAELEGRTSTPQPPARRAIDPNSRAARLARIIAEKYPKDAMTEPVDADTLTVYVTPASLGDWDWWLGRFHIPAGRMTYRGSYATATGSLGGVKVLLTGHGVGALYVAERNVQTGGAL